MGGLGVDSAQQIIAEAGATAATFPSSKHLASWMGACPGNEESAGVNYNHRCPKGNRQTRTCPSDWRHQPPTLSIDLEDPARARSVRRTRAVSAEAKNVRARKMIRELRSLGYHVEPLPAPSNSPA